MEKYYSFAGVDLCIRIPEEKAYRQERQLGNFSVAAVENPWTFDFQSAAQLPAPQGRCIYRSSDTQVWADGHLQQIYRGSVSKSWDNAHLCTVGQGKDHQVFWKEAVHSGPIGVKTVLDAINAAHLINQAGGCILHCSYIEHQGRAILFTAPSGVGKSTQAELWNCHRGAHIVNGDRAAIRMVNGIPMAEAIPFAGSSQYCRNHTVPLAAIVYLGQAKVAVIRPLTGATAFRSVWEGCTVNIWDAGDMATATQTVMDVIQAVPVCRLECPPDETAILALEHFLKGR